MSDGDDLSGVNASLLQSPAAAPSSASTSTAIDALLTRKKKKRRTYVARREEKAVLLEEMEVLHRRIALLKTTPPREHAALRHDWARLEVQKRVNESLLEKAALNHVMQAAIRDQQLHLAGSQSLLSSMLMNRASAHPDVPFASRIRLPADPLTRQPLLRGIKDATLREASKFMLARRQFLDLRRASHQADEFDLPNGDFKSIHWDVVPFAGPHTVKDVYDELLFFMMNQEMSATEHLDAVTIRESDDDDAAYFDVAQARLVTTMPNGGLTIEKNLAIFMQYSEASELVDEPHTVLVVQAVEEDEQFPYQPSERLRQDITAVVFITAAPTQTERGTGRPCISMTRWASVHMHSGDFATRLFSAPSESDDERRDDFDAMVKRAVHEWCDLMLTSIKERMRMRRDAHRRGLRLHPSTT